MSDACEANSSATESKCEFLAKKLQEVDVQLNGADMKDPIPSFGPGRKKARPAPSTLDGSVSVMLTCVENAVQVQLTSV